MAHARAAGTAFGLSFGAWHGVSMGIYLIACIALVVLVWQDDFR
jgi:hypothetical protein